MKLVTDIFYRNKQHNKWLINTVTVLLLYYSLSFSSSIQKNMAVMSNIAQCNDDI